MPSIAPTNAERRASRSRGKQSDVPGGDPGPYGPGWNRIRRAALQRDGHACVVCGKTSAEIGRNPDVHHITPVRAFVETDVMVKTEVHTLENVASLCVDCHRKADFGKIPKQELRSLIGADSESR